MRRVLSLAPPHFRAIFSFLADRPGAASTPARAERRTATRFCWVFLLCAFMLLPVAGLARAYNNFLSCDSSGYAEDAFLAYCPPRANDYEHAAYIFGTERSAITALRQADVLFFGSSILQFAFSTTATRAHFARSGVRHYLLGFGYNAGLPTARLVAQAWRPAPKIVVIDVGPNVPYTNEPTRLILDHSFEARFQAYAKWIGQKAHAFMATLRPPDPHLFALFRSRADGSWLFGHFGTPEQRLPVGTTSGKYGVLEHNLQTIRDLMSVLPGRACVVITSVPTSGYSEIESARTIADALGADYIKPALDGLTTLDTVHLSPESAARWSAAFLEALDPVIQRCVRAG